MTPALQAWQDSEQPTPEEEAMRMELREALAQCLEGLSPVVVEALVRVHGLDGGRALTRTACADGLGVSRAAVTCRVNTALRKLRWGPRRKVLIEHWFDLTQQSHEDTWHVDWDRAMRNALLWPIAFHQIRPWDTRPGWVGPTDEDRQRVYERDREAVPQWNAIPSKHKLYYLRPSYDFALALTRREKHDRQVAFVEGVARRGVHFQDAAFHVWYLAGDKRISIQHRFASLSYLFEMWFEWIEWYVVDGGQRRRAGRLDLCKRGWK